MKWWVVNEWLLEDLRGANGEKQQQQAVNFLSELLKRCDGIVVMRGSAWSRKAFDLMRQGDQIVREASKILHLRILRDARKCYQLSQDELMLIPCELQQLVKPDDRYLVQAYLMANADAIVTTDTSLQEALTPHGITVRLRCELLRCWGILTEQ